MIIKKIRSPRATRPRQLTPRVGMTTLEYIGCAVAIAGGVWLGAMYAGVDLQQAAHSALDETDLLEKVPPKWRPATPADEETVEQKAAKLRNEFAAIGDEISALHGNSGSPKGGAESEPALVRGNNASRDQTISLWQSVNQIAFDEAEMQKNTEAAFDATNAAKVFAVKARASQFASNALDALQVSPKADPSVVKFTRELSDWYENGADLYERAVQIWESPIGAEGRTQLNEEWNRAELQHRNEARLISEKAAALRGSLSRQFGVELAGFAEPRTIDASPAVTENKTGTSEQISGE